MVWYIFSFKAPRDHSELSEKGSLSIACWSSKGISAWPACRPHKIPASAHKFHNRTLLDNGLAIKAFFVTFRRFLCDMSRPAQFPSINSQADKEKRSVLLRFASLHIHRARFVAVPSARGPTRGWRSRRSSNLRRRGASLALPLPWRRGAFLASSWI